MSIITLGVADVAAARRFYEDLGWRGQEVDETVFFQAGGLAIVLWSRAKLAADAGIADDGAAFGGIALAHNVRTFEEVDDTIRRAVAAGARDVTEPADTFYGGYAGYFRDLDGHLWEVACNPGIPLADDGAFVVPPFDAAT